jgi:hypothetical protein
LHDSYAPSKTRRDLPHWLGFACWVFDEFRNSPGNSRNILINQQLGSIEMFDGYLMADPMHSFLFTLGYEGVTIEAFITRLHTAQATSACLVSFEYVARAARQWGGPTITHLTAKTAPPDLGYQLAA